MKLKTIAKVGFLTGALCVTGQAYAQYQNSTDTTQNTNGTATTTTDSVTTVNTNTTATPADTSMGGTVTPVTTHSTEATRDLTPAEDAKITQTVKELISRSKLLSKLKVEVTTQNGVVHLSGNVDADSEADLLIASAESVIGVKDVNTSNLTVKRSSQPFADTVTTAKIKGLLIREKLFGEKDVSALNTKVETKDGVVYLTGQVENKQQIDNAIDIIKKNLPEVKKVEYSLGKFTPGPSPVVPNPDGTTNTGVNTTNQTTTTTDGTVTTTTTPTDSNTTTMQPTDSNNPTTNTNKSY